MVEAKILSEVLALLFVDSRVEAKDELNRVACQPLYREDKQSNAEEDWDEVQCSTDDVFGQGQVADASLDYAREDLLE